MRKINPAPKLLLFAAIALFAVASDSYCANLPDRCLLLPVKGPCKAMIEKFYFHQASGKCTPYFYDGCGPVVPFDTLEECQKLCEQPPLPAKPASGIRRDPIEQDPRYADIFKNIDAEINALLANHPQKGSMGFVHIIWETKQRVLKQKYNINWKTPAEMNPQIMFD
jgi:hypothetical protein